MNIGCQMIRGEDPATMQVREECQITLRSSMADGDMDAVGVVMPDGRVMVCMILPDLKNVPADTININGSTVAGNARKAMHAARGLI